MNIIDIYRYLRNYITLNVSGGFTERFINLCNRENVYFWDLVYENGGLALKMYCKDFRKLRGIRRKSGVKIKIIQKSGFHFWVTENRKRKVLAIGVISALIVMSAMNNFVWSIEITGNKSIGKKEIAEMLRTTGLTYGTFVPSFDESKVGRDAVNMSDGKILWLAVNIKGSKATVEVRDYVEKNEEADEMTPCNILADFDGVILSAYTYSGTLISHSGTAVRKDDLLISGVFENENGAVDYLCADGEITAIHTVSFKTKIPDKTVTKSITPLGCNYRLKLFGLTIPLTFSTASNTDRSIAYTEYLTFDNNVIPIGIEKLAGCKEASDIPVNLSVVELVDAFTCDEYNKLKNSTIVEADYTITSEGNNPTVSGKYNCIDFIGSKSPIIKEN